MKVERPSGLNILELLGLFSGLLGIVGFFTQPYFFQQGSLVAIYQYYLCFTNALFICIIAYIYTHKRYRHAAITPHIHFVNHNIRDWIHELRQRARDGALRDDDFDRDFKRNSVAILDQIAAAFSHLAGVRCAVCIKELRPDRRLKVILRDSLSSQTRTKKPAPDPHSLEQDTPCHLLYTQQTPIRFYGSNDVIKDWQQHAFNSASFDPNQEKKPQVTQIGPILIPKFWPLGFRSCLVVPIRYTSCTTPPEDGAEKESNYWGFLCIDSDRRNVFDFERMWPLAATFADGLYIYFSSTFDILDEETEPYNNL